jgi:rare lipoprotein A
MNHRYLLTVFALLSAFVGNPLIAQSQTTEQSNPKLPSSPSGDVVKVGEYQNKTNTPSVNDTVTEIHTHNKAGRQAATLYIRKIPVLTFVGKQQVASTESKTETKVGAIGNVTSENGVVQQQYALTASNPSPVKVATVGENADLSNQVNSSNDDPVQRAGVIAARINDLVRQKVDANKIIVSWRQAGEIANTNEAKNKNLPNQESDGRYVIKVDGRELVTLNGNISLPDSTNNQAQDALQATNRLRRLIGNASPLNEIAGLPVGLPLNMPGISIPKLPDQIAIAPVRLTLRGIASFYGYDGSGNKTATGERFNPEGMTAAHRHLPFGTKVRVTNTRNGRSVIVRINDRGPFIRGRVIDLSYGAARVIGMIGRGVAPVKVEVLGR